MLLIWAGKPYSGEFTTRISSEANAGSARIKPTISRTATSSLESSRNNFVATAGKGGRRRNPRYLSSGGLISKLWCSTRRGGVLITFGNLANRFSGRSDYEVRRFIIEWARALRPHDHLLAACREPDWIGLQPASRFAGRGVPSRAAQLIRRSGGAEIAGRGAEIASRGANPSPSVRDRDLQLIAGGDAVHLDLHRYRVTGRSSRLNDNRNLVHRRILRRQTREDDILREAAHQNGGTGQSRAIGGLGQPWSTINRRIRHRTQSGGKQDQDFIGHYRTRAVSRNRHTRRVGKRDIGVIVDCRTCHAGAVLEDGKKSRSHW